VDGDLLDDLNGDLLDGGDGNLDLLDDGNVVLNGIFLDDGHVHRLVDGVGGGDSQWYFMNHVLAWS